MPHIGKHIYTQADLDSALRGQGEKGTAAESAGFSCTYWIRQKAVSLPRFSLTAKTVGSCWGKKEKEGSFRATAFPSQLEEGLFTAVLIRTTTGLSLRSGDSPGRTK